MTSAFEKLCGPGKPLKAEPPDAKEFAGLLHSGKARLKDSSSNGLALQSRFDLAYNAAHALCLAALRWRTGIAPAIATSCSSCCRTRWAWGRRYGGYYRSATTSATSESTQVT